MITGLDHVAIAVSSIEEARTFYEKLGLEITAIEVVEHEGVRVAMIPCGGTRIELLEPLSSDSPVGRFLERRGPGIHHLCMRSDDVHEDDGKLREDGLSLLRERPGPGAEGATVQFVHPKSAGGVLLELSEPAP
ncbi:MAG: methylmalonyl-CoA epimerase [Holophagales bacterium]|nr:methylmalonyl-CoA epimerase [Holophagales bacterium]MYG30717.1 methylmalonyl-CoA epimerase [Holophagales bacterium]MYI81657.1 methylmalonyl-CoA epimerase [Holophagales bacterium]